MDIFDEVNKIIEQHNASLIAQGLRSATEAPAPPTGLLTPKRDNDLRETLAHAFGDDVDIIDVDDIQSGSIINTTPEGERTLTAAQEKARLLEPRDYQKVGIEFLKSRRRALLSDQAGLGKTLQAMLAATQPVLVIAPTYLTRQWYEALCAQFPKLARKGEIVLARGSRMKRIKVLRQRAQWTVINIQMLRTFYEYVPDKHYKTIIVDEAHHIRNRKATQSKLTGALCRDLTKNVFLLTATPIWKSPDNLWMLLNTLQPHLFDSYEAFVDLFCEAEADAYEGVKVTGIKRGMTRALNEVLDVVRLGRSYKDAGRTIPPIQHNFIRTQFPKELKKMYDDLKQYWALNLEGLTDERMLFSSYAAVLHSLRALTAWDGKIASLVSCLDDVMAFTINPETGARVKPAPAVVYCWYKEHAYKLQRGLQAHFEKQGLKVVVITGDVKAEQRASLAMSADIVVATISSMSEGVNMYHARSVHYFEENWVPGSNYQSLSRVRRDRNDDGQDMEPVRVFYYHTVGTIDERIHRMTKAREGTIKQLISESLQ